MKLKKLHLLISAIIVLLVGLTYGIYPKKILPLIFDFKVESVDLNNFFRAIMGLYVGIAIYWIIGVINPKQWSNATYVCVIFMGGLVIGRTISVIIDGQPSIPFSLGLVLETSSMVWGIINLRNSREKTNTKEEK